MSWLGRGTKILHNSDWSHNHLLGDGTPESNDFWAEVMARHMDGHRWHAAKGTEPEIPQSWHRWADFRS
jgi:hypothetical protein